MAKGMFSFLTGVALGAAATVYILSDENRKAKAKEYLGKAEQGVKDLKSKVEAQFGNNFEDGWSDEEFSTFKGDFESDERD